MKQITIEIPDNCEFKQNGNTYTIVEKEKKLTYEDIVDKLFSRGTVCFIASSGDIVTSSSQAIGNLSDANNAKSEKQLEKLLALNKLMNVAKYLNDGWQPDWTYLHERRWYVFIGEGDKIEVTYSNYHCGDIYFKSGELARQAIEILGEEIIKLALCTDY